MKKNRVILSAFLLMLGTLSWLWLNRPLEEAPAVRTEESAAAEAQSGDTVPAVAAAGSWHAAPVVRPAVDPDQFPEVKPFQKVFALEEFPEETRAWVAAVEQGIPLRIDLGDGNGIPWAFAPALAASEEFVVSTGTETSLLPPMKTYRGRPMEQGVHGEQDLFLSVVGGRAAMMMFRDGDILHVRQNEAGDWEMERENLAPGAWHCTVENGISRTQGEEVLVAYAEENWERISITPEVAASDGRDPLTGELTMAERRIPYGQQYAASLRSMLGLMVWERVGANSESNIASRTAILLTLAASLNAIYENQIGLNYVLQEIILLVDGTDWEDSRLIYDGSKDSWQACLQTFGTWLGFHRPQTTRHWTVATKIGRVKGTSGWAWISQAGRPDGHNVNNSTGFSLVGHEIGHNVGSEHTSGGIMNASGNTSRDFFRLDSEFNSGETGAKMVWNYMRWAADNSPRAYGSAPLRNAAEIPFARDDMARTRSGLPVEIDVLANDLDQVVAGAQNTVLTVVETGAVFPPHAGTATHSADRVVFTPSPAFSGVARFSYTIRGNIGNDGEGWLHKGDVAVVVENPAADAPILTVERGPDTHHHDNERVVLRWESPGNRPESWEIQRAVNGSPFQPLGVTDGGDRHWIDLQIHRSSTVRYRMRAGDEGNGPGAWGYSNTLVAANDPHGFWEDFAAADLTGWEQWTNQFDSELPDDSSTGRFDFAVQNGRAVLTATEENEPRLGLLVRPQVYDVAETGDLTMAATLGVDGWRLHHRVLAWIDDGGAVIWIGLEQTVGHQTASQRLVRLYGVNTLAEFFQEVGNYNSTALLFQNSERVETGYVNLHRASLTISQSGVGMTVVPTERNSSQAASTLGLMNPGLSNFTGVGRFALGGLSNPQISGPALFELDHIGITSLPVPTRYLPALVDDFVEVLPGETVAVAPFNNDLWIVENTALQSSPPGWSAHTQQHDRNIVSIFVPPDTVPGEYEVLVRGRTNDYNAGNDGLTGFSSIRVTVLDQPSQANTLELVHYRGDPPLSFFPLANDWASGFLSLEQLNPRTFTNTTFDLGGNSYRLVSATLTTGSLGSITLRTMPAVVNGTRVDRNTGEIIFTRGNVNEGTANITYTFEDSRGQTLTGTVLIHLLRQNAPRISSHPLGRGVSVGDPLELSVTASGSGLSYQWFRNGTLISGAESSSFSVGSVSSADAGEYHVVVSNSDGSLASEPALVTVAAASSGGPMISEIPDQSTTYETPLTVSFTVSDPDVPASELEVTAFASDETLLPDNGIALSGTGESRSLDLTPALGVFGSTRVSVHVSNGEEWAETSFTFTVQPPPPPVIMAQPQPQSAEQGASATFSVTAEGIGTLAYQWFKDGGILEGETTSSLSVSNVSYFDSGLYTVLVSNDGGGTLSDAASLTVLGAPFILAQPQSQTLPAGAAVSLNVNVAGSTPMTYAWHGPDGPIADSNSPVLTIASMSAAEEGEYFVTASNALGSVTSETVTLAILPPPDVPANVTATAVSAREIALSWTDPSDLSDGFEIEWALSAGGPWELLAETEAGTFLHEGLTEQTTYFYRVRAGNEAGFSDWSEVAFATTPELLESRYLLSFGDLPGDASYDLDGEGHVWQSFRLRTTAGDNSAFLAHSTVVLKNTVGEEGDISFSASSTITGNNVGQNTPGAGDFGGNPFTWFNPAEEAQRITPAFNQQNSSITYSFSGFDPADAVTFEMVIRRTDTGRNITLVASGDGGDPVTLLNNADSGVTRFVTFEGSGFESYSFTLTSNVNTWVGTINAMSVLVEGSGVERETPTITAWPTASELVAGQTLGEAELSGGAAENALGELVAGVFVFENPEVVPVEGTGDYAVRFDPVLDSLYNSVVGLVSVTVLPPPPTFTVTYEANSGLNAPVDEAAYLEGASVTVLGPGDMVRSGHAFTGWNTAANGSGISYSPGDSFAMPAADITLYAQWVEVEVYLLSFTANGAAGEAPAALAQEPGDTVTLPGPGGLSKAGHAFNGWRDVLGAVTYAAGDTLVMPSADLTLTAQWTVLGGSGDAVAIYHEAFLRTNTPSGNRLLNESWAAAGHYKGNWRVYDAQGNTPNTGATGTDAGDRGRMVSNGVAATNQGGDGNMGFIYLPWGSANATANRRDDMNHGIVFRDETPVFNSGGDITAAHREWQNLRGFSVDLSRGTNASTATAGTRAVIQIGTDWFASATTLNPAATNTWETHSIADISTENWLTLSFDPANNNRVTLGATAQTLSAHGASGSLTSVGFHLSNTSNGSNNDHQYRIDNIVVTAVGGAAPGDGYTVTYDAGGGSGDAPVDGNQYAAGSTVTVMGPGNLTREGFTFDGWHDGTTLYQPLDTFAMPDVNVTLTAQWSDPSGNPPPPPILFVNPAADGANNGTSWADAFTSLRDALAAAQSGQEIWVAAGSYSPFVNNRATDTFLLPSGVALYGGFAGTESERAERDWLANETILSGHIEEQTNIRHIVTATGAEDARIDGFTIRDGHSDGENPYTDGVGAAVFVGQGEGRLTLANCRIVDNHAQEGGVVYFEANANDPELRIENTLFEGNSIGSEWARGVLQIRSNAADVWLEACHFVNNPSGIFSEAGSLQVLRSQFIAQSGIAVDINYHGALNDFVNCVFDQNGGGAIRMVNSQQLRVANCVFARNSNPIEYGSGGALNISQGRFEVYNSTFFGNSAEEGAAIAWSYGWAGDATSLIHNSIFWGNTGDNIILLERYNTDDVMTLELRNNLLQGGAASVETWQDPVLVVENLIDSDPLFVDAGTPAGADGLWGTADDGLRLASDDSPAFNAGLAAWLPVDWLDVDGDEDVDEALPLDLLDTARVFGADPSLGAYEQPASTSAYYWGGGTANWTGTESWFDNPELTGTGQTWQDGWDAVIQTGDPALNASVTVGDLHIETGARVRIGGGNQVLTITGQTTGSGTVRFDRTAGGNTSGLRFENDTQQTVAWDFLLNNDQCRIRLEIAGSAPVTLDGTMQAWGNAFDIIQESGSHVIFGPNARVNNNRSDLINARPFHVVPADATAVFEMHADFNADLADPNVLEDPYPFAKPEDDLNDGFYVKPVGGLSTWRTVSGTTITHATQNLASIHKYTGGTKRYTHHGLWNFEGANGSEPEPEWIVRTNPQSYDGGIYFVRDWTLNTEEDFTFEGLWHDGVNIGFSTRSGEENITFTKTGPADFILKGTQAYGPGSVMRVEEGGVRFHTDPMIGAVPLEENDFWFGGTGNYLNLEVHANAEASFLPPAGETFHLASADITGSLILHVNEEPTLAVSGNLTVSGTLEIQPEIALSAASYVVATVDGTADLSQADVMVPQGWELSVVGNELRLQQAESDPFLVWLAQQDNPEGKTAESDDSRGGMTLTVRDVWIAGLTLGGEDVFRVYFDESGSLQHEPDLGGDRVYTIYWTDDLTGTPAWRDANNDSPPETGAVFFRVEVGLP